MKRMSVSIVSQLDGAQRRSINDVQKRLSRADVFLVGGTIRDLLLRRPTKDLDIVIHGVSLRTIEKALQPLGTIKAIGRGFGVLKFFA